MAKMTIDGVGRVDTLTKGAQKALENMITGYGMKDGVRIFVQKAEEQGVGKTLRQRINSIYKKGGHLHG